MIYTTHKREGWGFVVAWFESGFVIEKKPHCRVTALVTAIETLNRDTGGSKNVRCPRDAARLEALVDLNQAVATDVSRWIQGQGDLTRDDQCVLSSTPGRPCQSHCGTPHHPFVPTIQNTKGDLYELNDNASGDAGTTPGSCSQRRLENTVGEMVFPNGEP